MTQTPSAAAGGGGAWGAKKPSSIAQAAARGSGGNASGGRGGGSASGGGRGDYNNGRGGASGGSGDARRNSANSNNKSGGGGGRGGGGRGGGGRGGDPKNKNSNQKHTNSGGGGRGGHNNNSNNNSGGGKNNNNNNNSGGNNNNNNKGRSKALAEIELWDTTGSGTSAAQKAVHRVSCAKFLSCRLQFLDAPKVVVPVPAAAETETEETTTTTVTLEWSPHERCEWTAADRVEQIGAEQERLWNYKPLAVNDDTRWKAKVMVDATAGGAGAEAISQSQQEKDAEQLRKAIAILNKLSWTTLNKLTLVFLETIGATTPAAVATPPGTDTPEQPAAVLSKQVVQDCMELIVDKAMTEPHFAELYARFCSKLATVHKTFKKTLLAICQHQFEESDKEPVLPADMDPAERKYHLGFSKRKSIGLMQFIGELYKIKLIKGGIMIGCLERLLVDDDDERLECFAKLMTTVGEKLDDNADEPEMIAVWNQVYSLAGKGKVPNGPAAPKSHSRIKFLLIDLIELKENGWVTRRVEEKAKTIAQIHSEVAREERQAQNPHQQPQMKRSQSGSAIKHTSPPVVDTDGFVQVPTTKPKKQPPLRRVQSEGVSVGTSSLQRAAAGGPSKSLEQSMAAVSVSVQAPISEYLEPKECGQKMKSILKEYFVGGDTDEAILSIQDLVGMGHEGHVERGAAAIEAGILLVIEMKEVEVRKFLVVISKCLTGEKVDKASLPLGLNDPLEFLRDVEIDAPLASSLLASIIAEWIGMTLLSLDFLQKGPEEFLSNGKPADFAAQIVAKLGGDVKDADIEVVSSLMSDEDKKAHPSVKEWLEAASKSS